MEILTIIPSLSKGLNICLFFKHSYIYLFQISSLTVTSDSPVQSDAPIQSDGPVHSQTLVQTELPTVPLLCNCKPGEIENSAHEKVRL